MALSAYLWILLAVETILYSFHLSVFILMVAERKSDFKGAFFNIFRFVIFADISCFVTVTFSQKIVLIPFFTELVINNPFIGSIALNIVNMGNVIQFFGHLFTTLNRFTLIWFPLKHENFWRQQWYTVIIFGVAILNASWRLLQPTKFIFGPNDIVNVLYEDSWVQNGFNISSLIITFSTTCFVVVLNVLSFVKFFNHKQYHSSLNVNEKNLLYVSLVTFIAQLFRVYYHVNRLIFPTNIELVSFFAAIYPILAGIFAWSGSISLMVLSSSTRKIYKSFYFGKSNIVQQLSSTIPPSNSKIVPLT